MTVYAQQMNGELITFETFEGYRVLHLCTEASNLLDCDRECIHVTTLVEDEYQACDPMDYVHDGERYFLVVSDKPNRPIYDLRSDPNGLYLQDEENTVIRLDQSAWTYQEDIRPDLHVHLSIEDIPHMIPFLDQEEEEDARLCGGGYDDMDEPSDQFHYLIERVYRHLRMEHSM